MLPVACNLNAIHATDRPRYNHLVARLTHAIRDRREVQDGYIFALDGSAVTLAEVAEWISLERLCCPFLAFQLSVAGHRDEWSLQLSGPAGVKSILAAAFS